MLKKPEYVVLRLIGDDIRNAGVRYRAYLRVIGPKRTEFDYWCAGFRARSLFVFLNRYSWGQMWFTVEWRGRTRLSKAWRWHRKHPRPVYRGES